MPARLITMPHSHYCEKARWALDYAGAGYREERHLPLLHRLHTRRAGGGSVPVLADGARRCCDSASIVRHANQLGGGACLLPVNAGLRSEALELEAYLDRELGPHARRWAYGELLGSVALLNACVRRGVRPYEAVLTRPIMLVARPVIRRVLRITPASAARSLARVHEVFAQLGERLAEGGAFLVGGEFTVADLTFAALASPVLLPEEFGGALPALTEVPARMAQVVRELRATRAGSFALELYRRHRRRRAA